MVGAGEGQTERLNTEAPEVELHSTPGTLLFSYGLFGTILFLLPFWYIVRTKGIPALSMFVPVLLYGSTHNGLRQSELWVLIILVGCNLAISTHNSEPSYDSTDDDDDHDDFRSATDEDSHLT